MKVIYLTTDDSHFEAYHASWTRVTALLDDPTDLVTVGGMFLEELKEEVTLDYMAIIIGAELIEADLVNRDEVEYTFCVLMSPSDYAHWCILENHSSFTLTPVDELEEEADEARL